MANGEIPDSSINASSYQSHDTWDRLPKYARLGSDKFWGSTESNSEPWIQVNLGRIHIVTRLQTEGDYKDDTAQYWVEKVSVKIGMDGGSLMFIEDGQGQPKVKTKTKKQNKAKNKQNKTKKLYLKNDKKTKTNKQKTSKQTSARCHTE